MKMAVWLKSVVCRTTEIKSKETTISTERTRISRLLWLEQREEVSVDRAELNELITLFGAGENRAGLTLLQERFGAKNRHMHALAKTRQGKIFETFPLLRPGSAHDKL